MQLLFGEGEAEQGRRARGTHPWLDPGLPGLTPLCYSQKKLLWSYILVVLHKVLRGGGAGSRRGLLPPGLIDTVVRSLSQAYEPSWRNG